MKFYRSHVLVGINDTSINAGVQDFIKALRNELAKQNLAEEINILETGPLGFLDAASASPSILKTSTIRTLSRKTFPNW